MPKILTLIPAKLWLTRFAWVYRKLQTTPALGKNGLSLNTDSHRSVLLKVANIPPRTSIFNCKGNVILIFAQLLSWKQYFSSPAASSAYPAFVAALVRELDCSDEVTVASSAAGFPSFQIGTKMSPGRDGYLESVLFVHYWWYIRRWASRHHFIANPVMSGISVSSTVTRNGMIAIDVKNSCFTEIALPFGGVYRDTQPVLCTNSKLIWCHMKPKSWNGWSRQPSSSMSERQWEKSGGFSLTYIRKVFTVNKFSLDVVNH